MVIIEMTIYLLVDKDPRHKLGKIHQRTAGLLETLPKIKFLPLPGLERRYILSLVYCNTLD